MTRLDRFGLLAVFLCGLWCCSIVDGQTFHRVPAPSPAAGTMFVFPERIPLKSGEWFTATRGQMFVPLNRSNPESDVISIEFYVFPRTARANLDSPPLFQLNGGPGFAGLEDALQRSGTFEQRVQPWLDLTDMVVIGQRGIGSSKPDTLIRQPRQPMLGDSNNAERIQLFRQQLATERDFWIEQGLDLSGLNVIEAAADVKEIAAGLGYDKISIIGGSFGSHWGMTLMRNHPELVARAVLHGMEGPNHTWDHPGWIWNTYQRIAQDAEQSELLQDLIPKGGLVKTVEELLAQAANNPVEVELSSNSKVTIDVPAMQWLATGYSKRTQHWPAEIITMHSGDFKSAARRLLPLLRRSGTSRNTASFWMLDSSSGITKKRRAEFESDPAMNIIGSTFFTYALGSQVWPADLGDDFRANFKTTIPTVIVQGTWDTSTPYENAVELAPFFEESRFVTVERGSHGAIYEAMQHDKSFQKALRDFIVSGDRSEIPETITLPEPKWAIPNLDDD